MHYGPELTVVLIVCVALVAGAATRGLSQRTRFPYTILMLLLGIVVGVGLRRFGGHEAPAFIELLGKGAVISPHLIIFVFLPALVFESAFALDTYAFRKNLWAVSILALPALVVSTFLTAALMVWLTSMGAFNWHWTWIAALAFGALASATDPVAVVAILRSVGAPKRLGLIIEGESLLNDGTAIVVFSVLLAMLTGTGHAAVDPFGIGIEFVRVVVGGLAVGLILAVLVAKWMGRTFNDPSVEITLTLVLAYAAMVVAEGFLHVSGVMAIVIAGLYMSGRGRTRISPEVSHFLHQFWEMLAYIANTLIFYLVGLVIATQIDLSAGRDLLMVLLAYAGIMVIRFVVTFGFSPLIGLVGDPLSAGQSTLLAWGGLRGAVSLALGLVVSQHPDIDAALRQQILVVTAGVVFMTILINGSTIAFVLRAFGFDRPPLAERLAQMTAFSSALVEVREKINDVRRSRTLRTVLWTDVERDLDERSVTLDRDIESIREELAGASREERTAGYWNQALEIERQAYWSAFAEGTLGATATQILNHEIDLQIDRLSHGDSKPPESRTPASFGPGFDPLKVLRRSESGFGPIQFGRLSLVYDMSRAESQAAGSVIEALEEMAAPGEELDEIRETYRRYLLRGKERLEDLRANLPEVARAIETRLARRIALNFEREKMEELAEQGAIDRTFAEASISGIDERMKRLWFQATTVALPSFAELCRHTPLFVALPAVVLEEVGSLEAEMVLAPGDYLFRENDKGDSMFIIARGAVHVIKVIDGQERVLDVLGGGDIIGEMALLTGEPRTASIRAATTVTLGRIDRAAFNHLMETHPGLAERIWAAFAEREFDIYMHGRDDYWYLDHDERLAWFRGARIVELPAGRLVEADQSPYLFVVTGSVEMAGKTFRAPSLVDLEAEASALEQTRVAFLQSPSKSDRSPDRSARS